MITYYYLIIKMFYVVQILRKVFSINRFMKKKNFNFNLEFFYFICSLFISIFHFIIIIKDNNIFLAVLY